MEERSTVDLRKFNAFLKKNKGVDFKSVDLLNNTITDGFIWNYSEEEKNIMLNHLRGYQRLLKVLPENYEGLDVDKTAKELLKIGIHSAVQIADMGKKEFIRKVKKIVKKNEELPLTIFKRAEGIKKILVLKYVDHIQKSEPHTNAKGLHI